MNHHQVDDHKLKNWIAVEGWHIKTVRLKYGFDIKQGLPTEKVSDLTDIMAEKSKSR